MTTSNNNTQVAPSVLVQPKPVDKKRRILSKFKRRLLRHVWLIRLGLVLAFLTGIFLLILFVGFVISKTKLGPYFTLASDFIFTPREKIEIIDGKTNILILGKGGGGHEAPDLTDTVMFVSVKHPKIVESRKLDNHSWVNLISLPRDIWIPELRTKLNSIYYWGNEKQPPAQEVSGPEGGGGIVLAKSVVEQIVGQPVHYGIVIDFEGFKHVIDVLEGVEVDIENSFVDEKFPIEGRENDECDGDPEFLCRYETLHFVRGKQLMNGETALKFARSRNAQGDEGTDFARAARQEKIISAIKNKALTKEIMLSPKKLLELKDVAEKYIETDIGMSEAVILARRLLEARENVNSQVLPEDFLVNPPKSYRYDNLYVFVPKAEDWNKVHEWVECVLGGGECG